MAVGNSAIDDKKQKNMVPPDGGWGWMVVLGTAMTNVFNQSMLSLFSFLYGDKMEEMGQGTQGGALVLGTMLFMSNFGGPISAIFLKFTTPRVVAMSGAGLCSVGIFFSGLTTQVWHLVVTYGILLGLGLGLIQSSTFVSINGYFKMYRGRAVGLSLTGTGIGQMLMPYVVRYLLVNFSFFGACLILSGLSLHGVAGCALLQPVEWHMKEEKKPDETEQLLTTKDKVEINRKLSSGNTGVTKPENIVPTRNRRGTEPDIRGEQRKQQENVYREHNFANISSSAESSHSISKLNEDKVATSPAGSKKAHEEKTSIFKKIVEILDLELLTSIRFINVLLGTALSVTSIQNFSLIYPIFLKDVAGMTKSQVAVCMSTVAGADIVGRLILPGLADKYKIKARWTLIMTCTWLIIARQALAYQTSLVAILAFSAFYGIGRSMVIVARNIAISENCRIDQVPAAVGLGMLTMGLLVPPAGYFLGWIRDYTGSYIVCITAQNMLLVLLLVTWVPDMLWLRYTEKKKSKVNEFDLETK